MSNSETTNNIWQPDPSWDYYILWHSFLYVKAKIDAALSCIKDEEYAMPGVEIEIKKILEPASSKLIEIVDSLPEEEEEEDDEEE
ncbi:hypothetical protein I8748_21435 [Nostoc sp. CENA67]|uniref:Uncharacterized protein n=1 Tax=Amazonocrinis nigriterrae CENA67 TaxID=2794033 RepID=A0A8J7HYP9_9NOST|nr:hypothetical protein [Amazonocrinis nigriterrae]MBH8564714.1 hypothetical protein [Amazonocrinis nigriterrae CENA67]